MTVWTPDDGCLCGHGQYDHGDGWTWLGRYLGHNSKCMACGCTEFRFVRARSETASTSEPTNAPGIPIGPLNEDVKR